MNEQSVQEMRTDGDVKRFGNQREIRYRRQSPDHRKVRLRRREELLELLFEGWPKIGSEGPVSLRESPGHGLALSGPALALLEREVT
jgi:hypothetical protein